MNKFTLLTVILCLVMLIFCGTLASCGTSEADEQKLLDDFRAAAPRAVTLYDYIYGDGLPLTSEESVSGYYVVADDSPIKTMDAFMSAMSEVFSEDYIEILSNTAFGGVSVDEGSIGAKFIERDGILSVDPTVTEGFGEPREFDLDTARIVKQNRFVAIIAVSTGSDELEVTMRLEDGVWKLDSALY